MYEAITKRSDTAMPVNIALVGETIFFLSIILNQTIDITIENGETNNETMKWNIANINDRLLLIHR